MSLPSKPFSKLGAVLSFNGSQTVLLSVGKSMLPTVVVGVRPTNEHLILLMSTFTLAVAICLDIAEEAEPTNMNIPRIKREKFPRDITFDKKYLPLLLQRVNLSISGDVCF